jgi:hypothetical protein
MLVVDANTLLLSLTVNVTLPNPCGTVGVPLTSPVLELIVIPVGNTPALTKYVYGCIPFCTEANGKKLVIAEPAPTDTDVTLLAVAVIGSGSAENLNPLPNVTPPVIENPGMITF